MTKTEAAIALLEAGVRMADACRRVGIRPTTVYAELRKRVPHRETCPTCRGEIPHGHRLDLPATRGELVAVTVPYRWLQDAGFVAALLDDAGIPVHEEFPKQRVTTGTLTREDDPVREAARFVWRA